MSTIRDPAVITNAGRQMMTAGGDITYTKAVLYGQDISHLTKDQLESLTSIGNPLLTVPVGISDKNNAGANTTVVLEATFQNTDLKADLPYTAVGFFAKRGDDAEKLVIVGVANAGAYLVAASPDGVATDALDIKVAIAIGDATNVTAVIDPAGSVTPATLNAAINKVTHDLTAKIDVKADQDDTEKSLATKADKSQVNVDGDLFSAPGSITSWASLQADGSKNVLRSVRTEGQGTAFNTGFYDAGILFGGNDTKALISVGYANNRAIVTGGNSSSVWHEDIAWKSDITNLQNQVNSKASASDVNSLNQTISALQQTVQSLQNTVNQQATQITGLQTQVNNQANEIKQLQETTIKGKTFSKSQEAAAEAWEKQNSQQIAFILDN